MHDATRNVYYPSNPQRVWPSPTPRGKKYVAADVWGADFPVFPLPEERKSDFKFKDQIADWVQEGRIRFPVQERIEIWNSKEQLLGAIAASEVLMAKNTLKFWAEMPNLDFWIGKRVGFGFRRGHGINRNRKMQASQFPHGLHRYLRKIRSTPMQSKIPSLSATRTRPERRKSKGF